jgi:hypothetical protein
MGKTAESKFAAQKFIETTGPSELNELAKVGSSLL